MKRANNTSPQRNLLEMPCGTLFDATRPRSAGVLCKEELAFCRDANIPLAYDPIQIGWISAASDDDICASDGLGKYRSRIAKAPQINAMKAQYQLRAWELRDLDAYIALLDDPQVWQYMPEPYPNPLTASTAAALIELSNVSNHHQVYAVLRNAEIVGQVRLEYDVVEAGPGVAEISYWLGSAHWGKGIGQDVVRIFTKRAFEESPGLSTLIAKVHIANQSSASVLTKAGFVLAGLDGKRPDWQIYELMRHT